MAGKVVSKHANCKGSSHRKKVREGQTLLLVGEGETVSVTRVAEDLQVISNVCVCVCVCVCVYVMVGTCNKHVICMTLGKGPNSYIGERRNEGSL